MWVNKTRKGANDYTSVISFFTHLWSTKPDDGCFTQPKDVAFSNFNVLLTVNDQLDAQFLSFIIRLLQSSTCFEQRRAHHQHLVSLLSVSGPPISDGHLQRVTIPDAVLVQFDLLMMWTTLLETCRGL